MAKLRYAFKASTLVEALSRIFISVLPTTILHSPPNCSTQSINLLADMSSPSHQPSDIQTAATAVANALATSPKYALVGGSACVVLGATRATQDIDFVVLRGQTPAARQLLRASPNFTVEPRTNHTTFNAGALSIEIEILAPPALFKEKFDQDTETIMVGNKMVLRPALILNAKCRSILDRSNHDKKNTDAADIIFLLNYCASNPIYLPKAEEVPNATGQFVQMFTARYQHTDAWTTAGYDLNIGLLSQFHSF